MFAIWSKHDLGGMKHDIHIYKTTIEELGYTCDVIINAPLTKKYKAVIVLEHLTPNLMHNKVLWMPNMEVLNEWDMELMSKTDTILCKTKQCYDFFKDKRPKSKVVYTKFTSVCSPSRAVKDNSLYLHLGGTSYMKGTDLLLKYWIDNGGFLNIDPSIKLFITVKKSLYSNYNKGIDYWNSLDYAERKQFMGRPIKCQQYMNVYRVERLSDADYNYIVKKAGTFIQPSTAEGYGHSINEGRCNGANVITTDAPPMNELVSNKNLLVKTFTKEPVWKAFPQKYKYKSNIDAHFIDGADFSEKLKKYIKDKKKQKNQMKAHKEFSKDTRYFKKTMKTIFGSI